MVLKNGMLKVLNSEKHLDLVKRPVPFEEHLIIQNFMLMERQKYLVCEKMERAVWKVLEKEGVTKKENKGQRNYGTYKKYFK